MSTYRVRTAGSTRTATDKLVSVAAARKLMVAALQAQDAYGAAINRAVALYGNGSGALISGVYREHFPDCEKTNLRQMCRAISESEGASLRHWRAAGKQLRTWRREYHARREAAAVAWVPIPSLTGGAR